MKTHMHFHYSSRATRIAEQRLCRFSGPERQQGPEEVRQLFTAMEQMLQRRAEIERAAQRDPRVAEQLRRILNNPNIQNLRQPSSNAVLNAQHNLPYMQNPNVNPNMPTLYMHNGVPLWRSNNQRYGIPPVAPMQRAYPLQQQGPWQWQWQHPNYGYGPIPMPPRALPPQQAVRRPQIRSNRNYERFSGMVAIGTSREEDQEFNREEQKWRDRNMPMRIPQYFDANESARRDIVQDASDELLRLARRGSTPNRQAVLDNSRELRLAAYNWGSMSPAQRDAAIQRAQSLLASVNAGGSSTHTESARSSTTLYPASSRESSEGLANSPELQTVQDALAQLDSMGNVPLLAGNGQHMANGYAQRLREHLRDWSTYSASRRQSAANFARMALNAMGVMAPAPGQSMRRPSSMTSTPRTAAEAMRRQPYREFIQGPYAEQTQIPAGSERLRNGQVVRTRFTDFQDAMETPVPGASERIPFRFNSSDPALNIQFTVPVDGRNETITYYPARGRYWDQRSEDLAKSAGIVLQTVESTLGGQRYTSAVIVNLTKPGNIRISGRGERTMPSPPTYDVRIRQQERTVRSSVPPATGSQNADAILSSPGPSLPNTTPSSPPIRPPQVRNNGIPDAGPAPNAGTRNAEQLRQAPGTMPYVPADQ